MAYKIIWSPIAADDLQGIASFISRDSEAYAASTVQKIIDSVETVSEFPLIGREVPELQDPAIREVIVFKYRVIYRAEVEKEAIKIGAIIHGARDLEKALFDRPPL